MKPARDHGGGLDAAIQTYGGTRAEWIDLSTGINPVPYPMEPPDPAVWAALPDQTATDRLLALARRHWQVPDAAEILAAPGASALIAQIPRLRPTGHVAIPGPTYNEHGAAFRLSGWTLTDDAADALVLVHPNNPDGHLWTTDDLTAPFTIIDESFCDVCPEQSLIEEAAKPGRIVLKSFGKFWGLAGLRLGFAIGDPVLIAQLREYLGPWAVSGPALDIGADALSDPMWIDETNERLTKDADRLDQLLTGMGAIVVGGTTLFRLYEVQDANAAQEHLAQHKIWSRIFPYSDTWLRLGLPAPDQWDRVEAAF